MCMCQMSMRVLRSKVAALRLSHEHYDTGVVHRAGDLLDFGDHHLERLRGSMWL